MKHQFWKMVKKTPKKNTFLTTITPAVRLTSILKRLVQASHKSWSQKADCEVRKKKKKHIKRKDIISKKGNQEKKCKKRNKAKRKREKEKKTKNK